MNASKSGIKKEPSMETVVQMEITSFHAKPGIYTYSAIVNSRCNSLYTCSDVMCGMIYCHLGDYQNVVDGVSIRTISSFVRSRGHYRRCR